MSWNKTDKRKRRTEGWGTPTNTLHPNFEYDDADTATEVRRRHFPNIAEFVNFLENAPSTDNTPTYTPSYISQGIKLAKYGDTSLVQRATDLMSKLNSQLPTTERNWHLSPVGFFPSVPDYLSGNPENMWRIESDPSDSSPVKIWVNILPSGGCSRDQLLNRGATLVALLMLLQKRRPQVSLVAYADQPCDSYYDRQSKTRRKPGVILAVNMPTNPLIISQICTFMGHPEVCQNIAMHAATLIDPNINGGWLQGHCPTYGYDEAKVRIDLGASPDDVVLPALHLYDPDIDNPVGFINRELARILGDT